YSQPQSRGPAQSLRDRVGRRNPRTTAPCGAALGGVLVSVPEPSTRPKTDSSYDEHDKGGNAMQRQVDRRTFLGSVGVGAAVAAAAGPATYFAGPRPANAATKVKGNVPGTPFKTGHITFLTGPANLLGEPGRKGHLLAAEEINAE